jgi:hypothetical protein
MKSTQKKTIYRQGDVLLIQRDSLPKNAALEKQKGPRVILAHGEVTGHHHSLAKGKARLYREPDREGVYAGIVEVAEAFTALTHQEHARITVPPGAWEVRRQREYHPEAIRNVAD